MTKREMIEAMLAGKILEAGYYGEDSFIGVYCEAAGWPFREESKRIGWNDFNFNRPWRIREEPAVRPMTRDEVLGFIEHAPGIAIHSKGNEWVPRMAHIFINATPDYEWATITPDGKIGEPHAFDSEAWATYKREVGE